MAGFGAFLFGQMPLCQCHAAFIPGRGYRPYKYNYGLYPLHPTPCDLCLYRINTRMYGFARL